MGSVLVCFWQMGSNEAVEVSECGLVFHKTVSILCRATEPGVDSLVVICG